MKAEAFGSLHESSRGYNYRFVITAEDLTEDEDGEEQLITLITLPPFSLVTSVATYVKTPFQTPADKTPDTTVEVGDSADIDRYIASQQINLNAADVVLARAQASTTPFATVAATEVIAEFGPFTGYSLSQLTAGEIHIFLEVIALDSLT